MPYLPTKAKSRSPRTRQSRSGWRSSRKARPSKGPALPASATPRSSSKAKTTSADAPAASRHLPTNCTLTIDGTGSLQAQSNGYAAGIGAGYAEGTACGNIVINGGTITARGGYFSAGIGGGDEKSCGDITINGGTVTAYGGKGAAGIGGGFEASCGTIAIGPDISVSGVTATRGIDINGYVGEPIGRGSNRYGGASCAGIVIDPSLIDETADATRTVVRQREIDLSPLAGNVVDAPIRTILTGTLATRRSITVKKDGAVITLRDVTINLAADESFKYPGIICNTNVTIILEGENYIKGHYRCPAIYVKEGGTLTIKGSGSLTAVGGSYCAGIGAGVTSPYRAAGHIVIESGSIKAEGGISAPGIGSSTAYTTNTGTVTGARCGTITITGGTVEAIANGSANLSPAAIGCGTATCGDITIGPDVTKIVATWNSTNLAEPIGSAYGGGACGTVSIALADVEDEEVSSGKTKRTYYPEWDGALGTLNRAVKVRNNTIITGTQTEAWVISIVDGAVVMLHNATFTDGLTCLGDAEVILAGENKATIGIGAGNTLTISGNGTLIAEGGGGWTGSAGIGGGDALNGCGNIEILGGTIIASSGGTAAGAAAIGSNPGASCGSITIGPNVKKVVATVSDTQQYGRANPIGAPYNETCGAITVDQQNLTDTTSADGLTRTITRKPGADAIAAYEGWRGDQLTNGVAYIAGAWNECDAKGVPNVMRDAFDKSADEEFDGSVVIDFETDGNGLVAIQTLPVVNGKGLFAFTIIASDNANGTGNVVEYPMSLESDGITYIEEEYNPKRFFRVVIDVKQAAASRRLFRQPG